MFCFTENSPIFSEKFNNLNIYIGTTLFICSCPSCGRQVFYDSFKIKIEESFLLNSNINTPWSTCTKLNNNFSIIKNLVVFIFPKDYFLDYSPLIIISLKKIPSYLLIQTQLKTYLFVHVQCFHQICVSFQTIKRNWIIISSFSLKKNSLDKQGT